MAETFTDRFNRLTGAMKDADVASILDLTEGAIRKLRRGETQTLKLHGALKLARRLGVTPWYIAGLSDDPLAVPLEVLAETEKPVKDALARLHALEEKYAALEAALQAILKERGWTPPENGPPGA